MTTVCSIGLVSVSFEIRQKETLTLNGKFSKIAHAVPVYNPRKRARRTALHLSWPSMLTKVGHMDKRKTWANFEENSKGAMRRNCWTLTIQER